MILQESSGITASCPQTELIKQVRLQSALWCHSTLPGQYTGQYLHLTRTGQAWEKPGLLALYPSRYSAGLPQDPLSLPLTYGLLLNEVSAEHFPPPKPHCCSGQTTPPFGVHYCFHSPMSKPAWNSISSATSGQKKF